MTVTLADATYLDRSARRAEASWWTATSRGGVVATAHYRATAAGAALLEAGGDAVDAAVAASLALGVCEPHASGLGGMALVVAHRAGEGRTFTLAGSCRAPALATPGRLGERKRRRGAEAIATPGAASVLGALHGAYGRAPLSEVVAPAVALARAGVTVTELTRAMTRRFARALRRESGGAVFLDAEGRPRVAGSVLVQPALAATLERIGAAGFEDFYGGAIAEAIDEDMREQGAYVRAWDLASMPRPRERAPLRVMWGKREVCTMGPPAGGASVVHVLRLHAALPEALRDVDTPAGAAALAGCIRQARRDRRRHRLRLRAGAPTIGFLGDAQVASRAEAISAEVISAETIGAEAGDVGAGETSHLVVSDRWGNVVSLTQSIERVYGSKVVTPSLGFVWNGYLASFKRRNPRHPHFLRPGAPARSNGAPTVVLDEGRVWAAVGATGSERVASTVAQALIRLDAGPAFAAVHAPRLHCTPEGVASIEGRADAAVVGGLAGVGLEVRRWDDYAFASGGLQLLWRGEAGDVAVADPRRDGAAWGAGG